MDRALRGLAHGKEEGECSQPGMGAPDGLALSCACLALTLAAVCLAGVKGARCRAPCRPGAPVDGSLGSWVLSYSFPQQQIGPHQAAPQPMRRRGSSELGMLAGPMGCEALMW